MATDKEKAKKGFSGLIDIASEISDIDEPINTEPKVELELSTLQKPPLSQRETSTFQTEKEKSGSPSPIETVSSGKSGVGSVGKWIIGIIGLILVGWLISNGGQSNKRPSYNSPLSSKNSNQPQSNSPAAVQRDAIDRFLDSKTSYPQTSSTQTVQNPSVPQSAGLKYTKPSVGIDKALSVPEIRWCIRESIRIEAMRDIIDSNEGIDKFNQIVDNYNSRCGRYRYRQGYRTRAMREVEPFRQQIVEEAIHKAKQLNRMYQASHPSVSPGASKSSVSNKPSEQFTREAQQLLTDLGYDPGKIDGLYGRLTTNAVKAFQSDNGITQDGWINQALLNTLKAAKTTNKSLVVSQPKPQNQTNLKPRSSDPSTTSMPITGFFTRGSHQDEVLRVQGKPGDISLYLASGYEEWKYGYSSVKISTRDRRVLSWNNEGNLKVKLLPGKNTSNTSYFTRNSHQDDVLRIQGTPDDISIYAASGYEEWKYGYSSIKISTRNRRVVSWNNEGNLKVKLLPGSNATSHSYFTRGSHQDDVLRVQGTPKDISIYSASGYEEWKYGYSSVRVSTRDRRVISWDNEGNLKVRYLPGSNVTNDSYFTQGSHQDDVLRVQGTPKGISVYSASGYEEWKYGCSSVKISIRDRRVISWDNSSGNLRVN